MLQADGIKAVDPADPEALGRAVAGHSAILVTAPPDARGCPAQRVLAEVAGDAWPDWIGYVSSTSVYGDRSGGWVFEDGPLNAASLEGARRVNAERDWLDGARGMGLTVQVFRLPGFYGPGRSVIDRLRALGATTVAPTTRPRGSSASAVKPSVRPSVTARSRWSWSSRTTRTPSRSRSVRTPTAATSGWV